MAINISTNRYQQLQEPITQSLHLPYKLYETTTVCIFLLYFRNCRALRFVCTTFICSTPNTIKHSTTQHKTIHYTKYFLGNLHVSLRGVKTVLKIERYMQWLTQGRNKLFGRSKLQDGLQPAITQLYKYTFHK